MSNLIELYNQLSTADKRLFGHMLYKTGQFPGSGGSAITLPLDHNDAAEISNIGADDHHTQVHVVEGADHTFPAVSTGQFLKDDATWDTPAGVPGTPGDTVTDETQFSIAAAAGAQTDYSRKDHTHGTSALVAATFNDGRIERQSDTSLTWTGHGIGIYKTAGWELVVPSSVPEWTNVMNDLDGNALAVDSNYDLFLKYSSGTAVTAEAKKWTNSTTRAVTPAKWQGRYCYDNSSVDGKKRRFMGTIRMRDDGGTAKFTDTSLKRFVCNQDNRQLVYLDSTLETTNHTYSTAVERGWNGSTTSTLVELIQCWILDPLMTFLNTVFTVNAINEECLAYVKPSNGTSYSTSNSIKALHASTQVSLRQRSNGYILLANPGLCSVYVVELGNGVASGDYENARLFMEFMV